MSGHLAVSPPLSRNMSGTSLYTTDFEPESAPLLGGDEEQGRYYVENTPRAGHSPLPSASAPESAASDDSKPSSTWLTVKQRATYYIPSTAWIPAYSLTSFWGDAAAGITVASILIPQSMSYATSLAKLDASTGLIAAAVPGLVYALLGTSKHLNVGPEAALSLLIGQAIDGLRHADPHEDAPPYMGAVVATLITFQVGLFSFMLGLFRLGFIDVVLSRALMRGFVTAVGLVIMVEQLIPMLGLAELQHALGPATTVAKIVFLLEYAWSNTHVLTAVISFGTLFALIVTRTLKQGLRKYVPAVFYVPEVFIFMVTATVLSDMLQWDKKGVAILGKVSIHNGGTLFEVPLNSRTIPYIKKTTSTAILIAVAGFLDSIVAAKQHAARFGYAISPNRELVALGAANLVSSFFPGTLPGYGAITRSKLNADTGGKSQMASIITSTLVILSIIFLLPALYFLPKCVLASIIGLVVYGILAEAPHDIAYYWNMHAWTDLALMATAFVFTFLWSVEVGIVVSVSVSLLLVVRNASRTSIKILGRKPGTNIWKPIDEDPDAQEDIPGVLIIRIRESLDFANTGQIKERLRRLELYGAERAHPSEAPRRERTTVVVFHMADVEHIDASAVQIFIELVTTYRSRGVDVHFTHLREKGRRQFAKAGLMEALPTDHFHATVADAIRYIESR